LLCRQSLRMKIEGLPFVYGVPSWAPARDMERITELGFEKFGMGAMYLARNAVLS
jgi:actin-related protein